MSEGMNRVTLIGNLGQDPELKYTKNGTALLNIRLATSESYVTRDGERKERTDWHRVVVWDKRAEGLNKCLEKGSKICVEGRIQTRKWEDQDGNKKYMTEIVATNVVLLGGKGERSERRDDSSADDPPKDQFSDPDCPF